MCWIFEEIWWKIFLGLMRCINFAVDSYLQWKDIKVNSMYKIKTALGKYIYFITDTFQNLSSYISFSKLQMNTLTTMLFTCKHAFFLGWYECDNSGLGERSCRTFILTGSSKHRASGETNWLASCWHDVLRNETLRYSHGWLQPWGPCSSLCSPYFI